LISPVREHWVTFSSNSGPVVGAALSWRTRNKRPILAIRH